MGYTWLLSSLLSHRLIMVIIVFKIVLIIALTAEHHSDQGTLDSTRPFWRATEYDLGHSSVPRWHASMRAARRQGMLGVVCIGTRPSSRVRPRVPPVQHLLRGGFTRGLRVFQDGQMHHGRFGTPEAERGGGGAGGSNCRRVSPVDAALGHAYADDAGVVLQPPEQLRKMMRAIVVVCAAFGLTVSEAKTEIICLHAKGVPDDRWSLTMRIECFYVDQ